MGVLMLQKQTFSMNLGKGMDQKSDDKIGSFDMFIHLQDWIYQKIGKIYKRPGSPKLTSDSINNEIASPLTIGSSGIASGLFSHKDQTLLENKGALYSFYENDNKWAFKGSYYPLIVETQTTISSELEYISPTSLYLSSGLRVIASIAYDNTMQNSTTWPYMLKYSVIEQSTGNIYVDDVTLDAGDQLTLTPAKYPLIIETSAGAYILYAIGSQVKYKKISLVNGSVIASGNLFTFSTVGVGGTPYVSDDYTQTPFRAIKINKTGVERVLFAFYSSVNNRPSVAIYQSDLSLSPLDEEVVITNLGQRDALDIYFQSSSNKIIVAASGTESTPAVPSGFYQLSSPYVGVLSINTAWDTLTYEASYTIRPSDWDYIATKQWITGYQIIPNLQNPDELYIYFTKYNKNGYSNIEGDEYVLYKSAISLTSGYTETNGFKLSGYSFAADPYYDAERQTYYMFLMNTLGLQASIFMVDLFKGKAQNEFFVHAKYNVGQTPSNRTNVYPQISVIDGKLYAVTQRITDITANPITTDRPLVTLEKRLGIAEVYIDLSPDKSLSSTYMAGATHLTGGYLGYYDGSVFREAGYFLQPELVGYSTVNAIGERLHATTVQEGSASQYEISTITFSAGADILLGPTYWGSVYLLNNRHIRYYYTTESSGSAPGSGGVFALVHVRIKDTDTAYQVARKTMLALKGWSDFYKATDGGDVVYTQVGATITIENQLLINTNPPGTFVMVLAPQNTLPAGSYQYTCVWSYVDATGNVIKSAPATPITVTIATPSSITVSTFAPNLTNVDTTSVRVEWYRTKVNGTTFYKISNNITTLPWSHTCFNSLVDYISDANIDDSPEVLYTSGGILQNYSIPACKHIGVYKNRLVASGLEDGTSVYFSKEPIANSPVEFTEENYITVEADGELITGHAQLDDKLIVFKKRKIFFIAGDPANDLGAQSSLTIPTLIAGDTGCVDHNSIIQTPIGLMFKSEKGIYLLDRALSLNYIGKEVEDYNQYYVSKAVLLERKNQIRFSLKDSQTTLVYDYLFSRWTTFSYGADGACMWKGNYARAESTGFVYVEDDTVFIDTGRVVESYEPTLKTSWLKIKNMQDYQRIYRLIVLGDKKSIHNLNFKIYYDYDDVNFDEYTFDSDYIEGSDYADQVYQPMIHLRRQKCDAIKIEMSVEPRGGTEECLELVDLSFQFGVKQGLNKVRAEKKV